jgi:hypothetical protein
MKAQELRIGNYIENNQGKKETVWTVSNTEIKVTLGAYHPKDLSPILLTEEWFDNHPEKEWEFVGFGTRRILQHRVLEAIKIEWLPSNQFAVYFNETLINAKDFVHEWQNLYFALTGEELKLQE